MECNHEGSQINVGEYWVCDTCRQITHYNNIDNAEKQKQCL